VKSTEAGKGCCCWSWCWIHAPCKHARDPDVAGRRFASNDDLPFQTRSDHAAWSCRTRPSRQVKRYMLLHRGLIAYPSGSASSYAAVL
jgi:hypothetical protein